MCNVLIDLGNSSVKAISGEKRINFSSKVNTKFNANKDFFDYVEMEEKIVYIGSGELDREYSKTEKSYFEQQVIYAMANLVEGNYKSINLGLLLPIAQLNLKEKYIETFKNKQIKAVINGKPRRFELKNVAVLPEGMTSYYILKNVEGKDVVIVDIGNFTINISLFENGKLTANYTEPLGVFNFYRTIMELENSKGNRYSEEDIQRLIKNEMIKVDKELYMNFLKDILNLIKPKCNLATYKSYFTGGGALLLEPYIKNLPISIVDDALWSNVEGLKILCEKVWGK